MLNLANSTQIESKLEQESGSLSQLKDRVDKYHDLSSSMSTILTKFEQRLGKLEQTILPVYNQTEHLQKRQKNLQSTLQCLDSVLSHYEASQEQCNLIHMGPSEGDIGDFLTGLDKLKRAKDYFLNNNPQSVELENVI